jgi:hypothetical protein
MAKGPKDGNGKKDADKAKKKKEKVKRLATGDVPCYTVTDSDGDEIMVSNFRARLLVTFSWPDGSRTYRVVLQTATGETEPLELDGWLMATRTRLNSRIGAFSSPHIPSWLGNDIQLHVLRDHISAQIPHCPIATRVESFGLTKVQDDYIWAFGNVAIRRGEAVAPNDDGIFRFSDGAAVHLADWCADQDGGVARAPTPDAELPEIVAEEFMAEAITQFDGAWGDAGLIALGWSWALQYRAICMKKFRLFPYLYLHGGTGGGKTSLAHAIGSLWYGQTDVPEVDMPEKGVPSMGTFRGFERTMASEVVTLVDEAGPSKVKHCSDLLKRMATGTSARRARRNDRADTRTVIPRAGVMLTSNGKVDGEEAFLRRCVVLSIPKIRKKDGRVSEKYRDRIVGKGWRMSAYLLHHLRKITGKTDAAHDRYIPPEHFVEGVRVRMKDLGDKCGNDQVAMAYAIAETGLYQLLMALGAIDKNPESKEHFNRKRMGRLSRYVETICTKEVSGRSETGLPGMFFASVDRSLTTGDASKLRQLCWVKDVDRGGEKDEITSAQVFLRVDHLGHALKKMPGINQQWLKQWGELLDELTEVDYLEQKNGRFRPPPSAGATKPAVRGVWCFSINGTSPESLTSLAETLCYEVL